MARPLDKKVVQERIKSNKAVMKDTKVTINAAIKDAFAGIAIDAANTRSNVASFIKAANAVRIDTAKLNVKEEDSGE